jgi:hypothetical protein
MGSPKANGRSPRPKGAAAPVTAPADAAPVTDAAVSGAEPAGAGVTDPPAPGDDEEVGVERTTTDGPAAAGGEPTEAAEVAEVDPNGPAPVSRALQQALHGLGVRSFADLDVFDPSHGHRG